MAAADQHSVVGLCVGKDCRKRPELAKLRAALDGKRDVVDVECLGICKGPVVVVDPSSDGAVVFSKLRTKQQRRGVVRVVREGRTPKGALAKQVVSGGKRVKAITKVRRTIQRAG